MTEEEFTKICEESKYEDWYLPVIQNLVKDQLDHAYRVGKADGFQCGVGGMQESVRRLLSLNTRGLWN